MAAAAAPRAATASQSHAPAEGAGAEGGFAIYVHWPFCASKCPYCDFNSHVRHGGVDEPRFAAALVRELETAADRTERRRPDSVFFGGGTPSLMSPATVGAVLDAVDRLWGLDASAEVTLEANPTSVEAGRFAGYRAAGVGRVSLGVQALDDAALAALGRRHTADEALKAVALAQSIFPRVTFDLIYARPAMTAEVWAAELKRALAIGTDHLSLYQLTIEEGTPFAALHAAGKLHVPDDDTAADLYELTQALTEAAGMPAYEVSNHARPGQESRHNLVYWRGGGYVGVGPGAHGRLEQDGVRRATAAERNPERWLAAVEAAGHGLVVDEPVDAAERADELLLMGLRLSEGVDLARHARHAGRPIEPARIAPLVADGLLAWTPAGRLAATPRGRLVLNTLIAALAA
ncbi:radical SAM family heme chaperone HemW [Pseudoxanthobacter sp. M-2]|uniref:radical SAM family heme chaperone HemW n=1 Tax=Pseudoxanthobacter sp. M-2 TaxID=3078754 RepID=UPI0038FC9D44